ncbi:F-box only protein 4 [Lingula anatina]|uniref:F-box only protein 4 n=1 Tax=Lingula anatina TaxID=7574 RepID=A0A1S3I3E1_LINAN|nr:F-box only protein 4 [Lingula anatina]|eukprot:XP_013392753.1 F-box only protein 4 [Lingula anatina]
MADVYVPMPPCQMGKSYQECSRPVMAQPSRNQSVSFRADLGSKEDALPSFAKLLDIYKLNQKGNLFFAGGIQQFLIHRQRENKNTTVEIEELADYMAGNASTSFSDLPANVKLHIFSLLSAQDLCRVSRVCKDWKELSSDNILWDQKLKLHSKKWEVIGHTTNPAMYKEVQSDWSNKEIYLRCSPEVNRLRRRMNVTFHNLSSWLRYLMPSRKPPMVAMFGPGLESSTSKIVRRIIQDKATPFKVTGMFPGHVEGGYGSGVTVNLKKLFFNLTILYTNTKNERENKNAEQRLRNNRLLQKQVADAENGEETFELCQSVKELCRTVDAFIFVVDSSKENTALGQSKAELFAMVNERWSSPDIPVVILSCVKNTTIPRQPCIDVVNQLDLGRLSKPWQVFDCDVETLGGVTDGIEWLVEQTHRL